MQDEHEAITPDMGPDDRIIRESGVEARVALAIQPVMGSLGYRLVRVHLSGQNGLTLQVMAERLDGTMTVEDCEEVSRTISPLLDVEDLIDKAYHLEVSSPGIDRPLVRKADFATWSGHLAKVETSVMVAGRKRFRGRITEAGETGFVLERDQPAYGEEPRVEIAYDALDEVRLVLTDELIREALAKDKKLRKAAKRGLDIGEDGEPVEDENTETDGSGSESQDAQSSARSSGRGKPARRVKR